MTAAALTPSASSAFSLLCVQQPSSVYIIHNHHQKQRPLPTQACVPTHALGRQTFPRACLLPGRQGWLCLCFAAYACGRVTSCGQWVWMRRAETAVSVLWHQSRYSNHRPVCMFQITLRLKQCVTLEIIRSPSQATCPMVKVRKNQNLVTLTNFQAILSLSQLY